MLQPLMLIICCLAHLAPLQVRLLHAQLCLWIVGIQHFSKQHWVQSCRRGVSLNLLGNITNDEHTLIPLQSLVDRIQSFIVFLT